MMLVYRFPKSGSSPQRKYYTFQFRDREIRMAILSVALSTLTFAMLFESLHGAFGGAVVGALLQVAMQLWYMRSFDIPPAMVQAMSEDRARGSVIIVNTVFTSIHPDIGPTTLYSVGRFNMIAKTNADTVITEEERRSGSNN